MSTKSTLFIHFLPDFFALFFSVFYDILLQQEAQKPLKKYLVSVQEKGSHEEAESVF